ncbi:MAG TPA: amidohydrolase family protein [Prosthecobacter sp.]|nr:amidohydrolase family protein [Prosthecobacter sp.]HRK14149.1 amidohydrolase family protein [Prosthecobacter sp.]
MPAHAIPPWSPMPPPEVLAGFEIWDSYLTQSRGAALMPSLEALMPVVERFALQKLCFFADVGLGTGNAAVEKWAREHSNEIEAPLRRWPDLMLGMIQLNAGDVPASMRALDRWLRDGPMKGVYFPGSAPGGLNCTHPNFDPLVARIHELGGAIMVHTWFKTGEEAGPHGSTPADLVALAARHPRQTFICAHAGGNWELGIQAVRGSPNIVVETSGFDATASFIEMAARELGAERILFGSHLPSRSLGTELGKVLFADIGEEEKKLILGGNFRRLLGMGR